MCHVHPSTKILKLNIVYRKVLVLTDICPPTESLSQMGEPDWYKCIVLELNSVAPNTVVSVFRKGKLLSCMSQL